MSARITRGYRALGLVAELVERKAPAAATHRQGRAWGLREVGPGDLVEQVGEGEHARARSVSAEGPPMHDPASCVPEPPLAKRPPASLLDGEARQPLW